jgi:HAE1 family hydrophobic/amphiphilic exporter-1
MLASRLLGAKPAPGGAYARFMDWSDARLAALENGYARVLGAALRARWAVLAIAAAVIAATVWGFGTLGSEFMGKEDTGQLSITYQLPLSTRYEITAETGRRILAVARRVCGEGTITSEMLRAGGTGGFGGGGGSHAGTIRLRLVDAKFRPKTADEYGDEITREVSKWPEIVKVFSNSGSFMNRILMGGGANLEIEIYGYDLDATTAVAEKIKAIAAATPGSRDVRVSQDMGKPELSIAIDRAKASAMGLTMQEITETVSALFQGADASQYREGEDEYDITLRLPAPDRASIEDIRRTELPLPGGGRVRLDTIAEVVEGTGPVSITRKNQQRIVNVEFDATDARPEGDVMADVRRRVAEEIVMPNGVSVEYGGMIEEQEKSEKALTMMILLGIVLVYMVMAAQFESLLHPLLIMFSVPFAFSGVVAVLHLTGTPLSMSAYIGMVLLVGIVVNNSIVLVDYVNLLRARGRALREAIVEGGRQRLRPVMITTCTTVLGMMPMATSHGDGSATWRPLGLVVVGGLAIASLVSMVLVPTLYYIVERRRAAPAGNQASIQHSNP